MNFISTFDELNKLYEEMSKEPAQKIEEGYVAYYGPDGSEKKAPQWWLDKGGTDASWREQQRINNSGKHDEETGKYIWGSQRVREACAEEDPTNEGYVAYYGHDGSEKKAPQWWLDKGGTDASWQEQQRINNSGKHDEETGKYIWGNQRLRCAAEDTNEGEGLVEAADEVADEAADEPKQVIVECDKCGALAIVDEADIVIDEKTDLVNVDEACKFCEEAAGYKIIGVLAPYEAAEEIEIVDDDIAEDEIIEEGLSDAVRKAFDKPASIATQQAWEDELNDDSTTPERRAELEKKFAQQRDWEAKHPDKKVK